MCFALTQLAQCLSGSLYYFGLNTYINRLGNFLVAVSDPLSLYDLVHWHATSCNYLYNLSLLNLVACYFDITLCRGPVLAQLLTEWRCHYWHTCVAYSSFSAAMPGWLQSPLQDGLLISQVTR